MAGIKLRVMQNPVYIDMFKGFGANAVPLAFSELFTPLETGTVDGQENPVTTIESSKFYEVQKHLAMTRHVYSPWIVTVSKKWYDGLSADEKKTLKALETVTGAGNIGDNGAGSHLPHAEPAGTNDAAERDGQKNNI